MIAGKEYHSKVAEILNYMKKKDLSIMRYHESQSEEKGK